MLISGHRSKQDPVLVNLSGGVDSTYLAWGLLSAGYRLVIHHAVLINSTGRHGEERVAVERVLRWLDREGLDRYEYVTTRLDLTDLGWVPYDIEVVGFLSGTVLRSPGRQRVRTVAVSSNADDATARDPNTTRGRVRQKVTESMANRPIDWWWPIRDRSKADLVAAMPTDLLAATWWCREPTGNGKLCDRCRTCRQMSALPEVVAVASASA